MNGKQTTSQGVEIETQAVTWVPPEKKLDLLQLRS